MKLHQIKVTLAGTRPPIWRRVLLSPEITLGKLHPILQIVMGWKNCHLHRFLQNGKAYSNLSFELGDAVLDESKVSLGNILSEPGSNLVYEYDFGDGWAHELLCEEVLNSDEQASYAICMDGARACPPEDCGGPDVYSDLLRVLKNPKHKDYEEMRHWVDERFNPEIFNLEEINERLSRELRRKK